jgi:hypothetical protein
MERITPAILDLAAVSPDDAIIFFPANHYPPTRVAPYPGAPGFEDVVTCLASPEARARTEGVIAWSQRVVRTSLLRGLFDYIYQRLASSG